MFIRKNKYPSGNVGVIVAEKVNGRLRELHTIGIATVSEEIGPLVAKGTRPTSKGSRIARIV